MDKLKLQPSESGYAGAFGNEVLAAQLSGGPSRMRRDFIGAVTAVNAGWTLPPVEFNYLQAFYRTATLNGSLPFLVDLLLEAYGLQEYEARFVPGSWQITGVKGLATTVTAQLEVRPRPVNDEFDRGLITVFDAFEGNGYAALDELEHLVNVDMPTVP